MSSVSKVLKDDGARRDAISLHDRSILVEAGAGSGKTAVMAGRIAVMLAEGVSPRAIAAVTFTELAASELLSRVREFVADLTAGKIAPELRVALPNGLSQAQRDNLAAASAAIDEITCSTIHGFCQRLIKPYPAEADIDPGAGVMDRNQADLTFLEIVDGWLRERLSGGQGGILAEMVLHSPGETVALIHKIAENLRRRRTLSAPPVSPLGGHLTAFRQATADFAGFMDGAAAAEPETAAIVAAAGRDGDRLGERPRSRNACGPRPAPDLASPPGPLHQGRRLRLLPQEGQMGRRGEAGRPLQGRRRSAERRRRGPLHRLLRRLGLACAGRRRSRPGGADRRSASDPATLSRLQARERPARFRRSDFRRARSAARP